MSTGLTTARPPWVGTAVDKVAIALIPIAQFIITIPLLLWSLLTTIVAEIASFISNAYVWFIMFGIWILLLLIVILWDPLIAVILTILWPILQLLIFFWVVMADILYIILIILILLWNSIVPLITLVTVYCVDFALTALHLLAKVMTNEEITQFIYDTMEIMWFYVDLALNAMLVVLGVFPANLTAVVTSLTAVLYYIFKAATFLAPLVEWVFFTLWKILPPILLALKKMVHSFHSVLGAGAFVSRSLLSVGTRSGLDSSSRYDDSVHAFASELIHHAQWVAWDDHIRSLNNITTLMDGAGAMPQYLHLDELFASSSSPHAANGPPPTPSMSFVVADDNTELRPLHVRFRQRGALWHAAVHDDRAHLDSDESTHARAVRAFNEHAKVYAEAGVDSGGGDGSHDVPSRRDAGARLHAELMERFSRGGRAVDAFSRSMHRVIDRAPSVSDHVDMIRRTADGLARRVGYRNSWEAIDDYQRNHRTAWDVLERVVPDVTRHPLFKKIIEWNPEENSDHRAWHFDWRRSPTPVSGFHNSDVINRRGIAYTSPQSEVASVPNVLPVTSVADCFHTHPRNILCIPVPPANFRFPMIFLKIPTDLSRDCPCFRPVPNILTDGSYSIWKFLNPLDIVVNTYCWLKILFGFVITVVLFFDHTALKYPFLRTIIDFLFIFQNPNKGPLDTRLYLCLLAYVFYPYTVVFFGYTLGIFWGPFRSMVTAWYLYFMSTYRAYTTWRGRLLDWYRQPDVNVLGYTNFAPTQQVADRMFLQPAALAYSKRPRLGRGPAQTLARVNPTGAGGTQYSLHVQGGIDESIASSSLSPNNVALVVDPLASEYDTEMRVLSTALDSAHEPDALAGAIAMLEAPLVELRRRHERALDKLQQWAYVAHEHGLLVPHITHAHHENALRWRYTRGRAPIGSYQFTVPYLQDLCHNLAVQRGHKPYDKSVDVPR